MNVGIDLGTTYSAVACVDGSGVVRIIDNLEGERLTPSAVFINGGEIVVGADARIEGQFKPECLVKYAKNHIGDPDYVFNVDGNAYSPADISGYVLEKLVIDAKEMLGEEIDGAVITCPLCFDEQTRAATRLAAEKAGLNVLQILDEPTAAALAYGYSKQEDMNKTILIYDLGGGTFDSTVMKLDFAGDKHETEIIAAGGDRQLGGKDWDEKLAEYVLSEFCNRTGFDPKELKCDSEFIEMLGNDIERVKKMLSFKESANITVKYAEKKEKIEVTRAKFEEITESLLNQTIVVIDNMLSAKNMTMDQIGEIILVGGSTGMPQVKARLEMEYCKPINSFWPDCAVARGAALMASFPNYFTSTTASDASSDVSGSSNRLSSNGLSGIENIYDIYDGSIDFLYILKSYGIITVDTQGHRVISNIILKDTKRYKVTKQFRTDVESQDSLKIEIFENWSLEDICPEELGFKLYEDYVLQFPHPVSKGTLFEVTFNLNGLCELEVEVSIEGVLKHSFKPVRINDGSNDETDLFCSLKLK